MAEKMDCDQHSGRFYSHDLHLSSVDIQHNSVANRHRVHFCWNRHLDGCDFLRVRDWGLHQHRGRRKFREESSQKHPLYQRTYGNLRGIEVAVTPVQGRVRSALGFVIDPITSAVLHILILFVARKARLSSLDRYEDGKLWLYNGFGQLVALDAKNPEPRMVDEQRLRIALKKGQVEIRTDNSADLSLILSVLSQAQTAPKV